MTQRKRTKTTRIAQERRTDDGPQQHARGPSSRAGRRAGASAPASASTASPGSDDVAGPTSGPSTSTTTTTAADAQQQPPQSVGASPVTGAPAPPPAGEPRDQAAPPNGSPAAAPGGLEHVEHVTLAALKPDPHNRRHHPARNLALIGEALQNVGAARSIVIDETNEVLAGNGVVEAARVRGLTKVQIVDADGDTIVAVRRRGLTVGQKRELALYDNRTGELAEWNAEQLDIDLQAGLNFAPWFTDQELAKLLPTTAPQPTRVQNPDPQFVIIVSCADEAQQTGLLERLLAEGFDCRAVVS